MKYKTKTETVWKPEIYGRSFTLVSVHLGFQDIFANFQKLGQHDTIYSWEKTQHRKLTLKYGLPGYCRLAISHCVK
jgi:hypothetical protein